MDFLFEFTRENDSSTSYEQFSQMQAELLTQENARRLENEPKACSSRPSPYSTILSRFDLSSNDSSLSTPSSFGPEPSFKDYLLRNILEARCEVLSAPCGYNSGRVFGFSLAG